MMGENKLGDLPGVTTGWTLTPMRLNKLTDYAVLVLIPLGQAWATGGLMSSRALAQVANVPAPTVAKLLKVLAAAGLVKSTRGIAGGYQLQFSPSDISVAQILNAVEGPLALTECITGAEGECSVQSMCWMRGRWDPVNAAVSRALEQVSLRDMMPAPFSFEPDQKPMAAKTNARA